jgi:hypothetical protein
MELPRRETAAARRAGPAPVRSAANGRSLYEGRILAAQSQGFVPRTEGSFGTDADGVGPSAPDQAPPAAAPPLASPALVILAALGVLEGYRQFHLVPSAHLRLSASAFAVITPLAAVLLARSAQGWHRTVAQRSLLAVALLIGVATPVVLAGGRSDAGLLLGIGDMAVAAFAVWAVLAGERRMSRSPQDP